MTSKRIITLSLDENLVERLEAISPENGSDINEHIVQAVSEYVDCLEEYQSTIELLGEEEKRPMLWANDF
ncbi:MAG: ribbon-helix-helix protein, CopG family [Alphaproteobacteria bacterium]|nr:ribbon-helix-helix protein, CopG family [Alphaproteobacteria bacterium]